LVAGPPQLAQDPSARRRVLVVDDNKDAARSLARLLRREYAHEVTVAHDGPGAIAQAEAFKPDVVLLDIGLPGLNGYEVAATLRGRREFAHTLIVALTGWGQEHDRKLSREAGIDRHLVKPVDPEDLFELLSRPRDLSLVGEADPPD
jgi:CheY-like chemotaxis protein